MRIIANENIAASVIRELRARGHDVFSVKEAMRGKDDDVILARVQNEGRLVITHDKDFGELAFRAKLHASCGIVLFRLTGASPEHDHRRIVETLESSTDWEGHFAVVTDDRIRLRPLPAPPMKRPRKPK